jgi:hypothetical protein
MGREGVEVGDTGFHFIFLLYFFVFISVALFTRLLDEITNHFPDQ